MSTSKYTGSKVQCVPLATAPMSTKAPSVCILNNCLMRCPAPPIYGVVKPASMHSNITHHSGAVLIVSLIMLLLLTLIGATAMQTTTLEEKIAGNLRDKNLAFQAAESALNAAEATLNPSAPALSFTDPGTGGFYSTASTIPTAPAILTDSFWTAQPTATSSVTSLANVSIPPVYIIQKLPAACFKASCPLASDLSQPYRITVRATGGSTNAVVILQTVYTP